MRDTTILSYEPYDYLLITYTGAMKMVTILRAVLTCLAGIPCASEIRDRKDQEISLVRIERSLELLIYRC